MLPIRIFSVGDANHFYDELLIFDFIDHSVIAGSDAPKIARPLKFDTSVWSRIICKFCNSGKIFCAVKVSNLFKRFPDRFGNDDRVFYLVRQSAGSFPS